MKKCPFCGEEIQDEAIKCKYCKKFLNEPLNSDVDKKSKKQSKLTPEELEYVRTALSSTDVRPTDMDVSFEAWLMRIGMWGKVKILHIDPEFKFKGEISQDWFLKKMRDDDMVETFGKWQIEALAVNKCRFYRTYQGLGGRRYTEEFIIEVDLKPELKRALGKK